MRCHPSTCTIAAKHDDTQSLLKYHRRTLPKRSYIKYVMKKKTKKKKKNWRSYPYHRQWRFVIFIHHHFVVPTLVVTALAHHFLLGNRERLKYTRQRDNRYVTVDCDRCDGEINSDTPQSFYDILRNISFSLYLDFTFNMLITSLYRC